MLAVLTSYGLFGHHQGHSFEPLLAAIIWAILTGVFITVLAVVVEADLLIDGPTVSGTSDFALIVGIAIVGGIIGVASYTVPTFLTGSAAAEKRPVKFMITRDGKSVTQDMLVKAQPVSTSPSVKGCKLDLSQTQSAEFELGTWKFIIMRKSDNSAVSKVSETKETIREETDKPYSVSIALDPGGREDSASPSVVEKDDASSDPETEPLEQELQTIRSDIQKIDSLIKDAQFQQAKDLVNETTDYISEIRQEASERGVSEVEDELATLEQECTDRISKSYVLSQLREMDPYEFERVVAQLWEHRGWDVKVTTGSNDRGADIIATKEDAFEKRRHLIQVKRYGASTKVGSGDIQRYAGLYARQSDRPDAVFVVTSGQFTKEARNVAENRDVRLVDSDELYRMFADM